MVPPCRGMWEEVKAAEKQAHCAFNRDLYPHSCVLLGGDNKGANHVQVDCPLPAVNPGCKPYTPTPPWPSHLLIRALRPAAVQPHPQARKAPGQPCLAGLTPKGLCDREELWGDRRAALLLIPVKQNSDGHQEGVGMGRRAQRQPLSRVVPWARGGGASG